MKIEEDLCKHGFSYNYCPDKCIRFYSMQEKIAKERQTFLREFKQTPLKLEVLRNRKRFRRMNPITKETFVARLIEYHRLERTAKF